MGTRFLAVYTAIFSISALGDPSHGVSQRAVEAALRAAAPPAKIEALVTQLGSESFTERESAKKQLKLLAGVNLPQLRKLQAQTKDAEIRRSLESLLEPFAPVRYETWIDLALTLRNHILSSKLLSQQHMAAQAYFDAIDPERAKAITKMQKEQEALALLLGKSPTPERETRYRELLKRIQEAIVEALKMGGVKAEPLGNNGIKMTAGNRKWLVNPMSGGGISMGLAPEEDNPRKPASAFIREAHNPLAERVTLPSGKPVESAENLSVGHSFYLIAYPGESDFKVMVAIHDGMRSSSGDQGGILPVLHLLRKAYPKEASNIPETFDIPEISLPRNPHPKEPK